MFLNYGSNNSFSSSSAVCIFFLGVAAGMMTVVSLQNNNHSYLSFGSKKIPRRETKDDDDDNNNNNNKTDCEATRPAPRRYGAAIRLKPEMYRRYRELHDAVWPEVKERMSISNIRNFTIYYHKETSTLFQHFEWVGHWTSSGGSISKEEETKRFNADMKAISDDPVTRSKWWKECEPCQIPFSQWKDGEKALSDGGTGDWWAPLECVTHCGHWPVAFSKKLSDPDFVKYSEDS